MFSVGGGARVQICYFAQPRRRSSVEPLRRFVSLANIFGKLGYPEVQAILEAPSKEKLLND